MPTYTAPIPTGGRQTTAGGALRAPLAGEPASDINLLTTALAELRSLLTAVDGTSDAAKPVSTAQAAAIAAAITNLVGAAPATRDTLKELSDILTTDETGATALATLVGTKASTSAVLLAAASDPSTMATGTLTYSVDQRWLLHSTGVQWPDGATGVFDATLDPTSGAAVRVLGYTVTHVLAGAALTFTQPAVTYAQPADTVPSSRPPITVASGSTPATTPAPTPAPTSTSRTISFDAVGGKARAELKVFTDWLGTNNVRGLIGEIGIPGSSSAGNDPNADTGWLTALDGWYAAADAAGLAVTAWTASEWNVGLRAFRNTTGASDPLTVTTTVGDVIRRWPGPARGVNLAGAEFGDAGPSAPLSPRPGTAGQQYAYPTQGSWQFLGAQGVKLVRLPVRWERLQPTLGAALDTAELGLLTQALSWASASGISVLIDQHNYARYTLSDGTIRDLGQANPAGGTMTDAFVDFWTRMATQYKGTAGLWGYGLTNEPHDLTLIAGKTQGYETWQDASSRATEAIRAVDWQTPAHVTVCGYNYGNTHAWTALNGGTPWLYTTIPAGQTGAGTPRNTDPLVVFEAHHYLDIDHSGTYGTTEAAAVTDAQNRGYTAGSVTVAASSGSGSGAPTYSYDTANAA